MHKIEIFVSVAIVFTTFAPAKCGKEEKDASSSTLIARGGNAYNQVLVLLQICCWSRRRLKHMLLQDVYPCRGQTLAFKLGISAKFKFCGDEDTLVEMLSELLQSRTFIYSNSQLQISNLSILLPSVV